MTDPSPQFPIIPKEETMPPGVFPHIESHSFSQVSPYPSPSFPHQYYMNWGMPPYMQFTPSFDPFHSQPCYINHMVPSDPFPSSNLITSSPNENIPPIGGFEMKPILSFTQTKKVKKNDTKKRTMFTSEQTHALNSLFSNMNNLMKTERIELGDAIGLNQNQIKIWLQNRRYKEKKKNVEVVDALKSKYEYDEEKAKAAVRVAIEDFKRCTTKGINPPVQYFPY